LVCSQQYVAPFGSGCDLSVYTRTAKGYGFVTVNADGSTHAPALEVQRDGSLVYTSTFQDRAVRVIDQAVNRFPSPNLELWTVRYSTDGGRTWTTMANGRASKLLP
jgi:DNA-binding beta-propeller fold protein YncE